MRIAVWHNLLSGGAKRALYGQVSGLLARGHRVEVWCPDTADKDYLPLSTLTVEHRLGFSTGRQQDPAGWRRFLFRRANARKLATEMDRHCGECAKQIVDGNFDLVFAAPCSFYGVPRLGQFLAGHGIPVTLYLQEPWRRLYEAQPELPWLALPENGSNLLSLNGWKTRLWDRQYIGLCREAVRREVEDARTYDVILANSYFSRESIARAYNLDARVAYLGCDTNLFRPLHLRRENFVVGLGSAHWFKRMDTAIEAVACLPEPRPRLVWIANTGDATYEAGMLALARLRGVDLEIRKNVGDDLVVQLLNQAKLLLYTSRLEPFGYAPVEANACGTPVVAVAEGGVRETVIDGVNGFLCDRDPKALAAAMQCILSDEALWARMAAAGVEQARVKWGWDASVDVLERHFERSVEQKRETIGVERHAQCI